MLYLCCIFYWLFDIFIVIITCIRIFYARKEKMLVGSDTKKKMRDCSFCWLSGVKVGFTSLTFWLTHTHTYLSNKLNIISIYIQDPIFQWAERWDYLLFAISLFIHSIHLCLNCIFSSNSLSIMSENNENIIFRSNEQQLMALAGSQNAGDKLQEVRVTNTGNFLACTILLISYSLDC